MTALTAPRAEKPALAHDTVVTTAGFHRSDVKGAKCVHNLRYEIGSRFGGSNASETGRFQAALANSAWIDFSKASSFCTLGRCIMRSKCFVQCLNFDKSSSNCRPRR
jgi:hypothetical protein